MTAPQVWNKRDPLCPVDAVYVGRPSKWGNPFKIGPSETREQAIEDFRIQHVGVFLFIGGIRQELRGKDLVCWCAPLPCHADVLLEIANKETP